MRALFQQVREEIHVMRNELAEARLEISQLTDRVSEKKTVRYEKRSL